MEAAAATATELGAALHGSPYAGLVASSRALAAAPELLGDILTGDRICAYGRLDPASGIARAVDGAPAADALLLEDPAAGDLLLLTDPSMWTVTGTPHGFDVSRQCADVAVDPARGMRIAADATARDLFGLLLAADALGGTERVLERTVAYAKDRRAFGRAIGGFQAVQHRLADHAVRVRGMSLLVREAARAIAHEAPDAHRRVLLAEASVSASAGHILHDLLQLTGAIGFTWEYGLHFFERRVHQDARLAANPRRARHDLTPFLRAESVCRAADRSARRIDSGAEGFRDDVRAFVAAHGHPMRGEGLRVPRDAAEEQAIRAWLASLYGAGYLGGGWPVEWGGRADHHPMHDLIVMEELILGDAYRPLDQVMLASHALLTFGTDEQKATLLPRIRAGEHVWCQLFSEPDAGSDLASLRTRAEPDGDGWLVTGQKIWCTDGQWADMGTLLARTDPSVDRHAGITAFIIPMDLPGIDIRPIREITGHEEFCEVFLDGVRVGPEHVLGEVDDGWRVITSGLASERAFVGANAIQLQRMFDDLVALARAVRLPDGTAGIEHEDVRGEAGRRPGARSRRSS